MFGKGIGFFSSNKIKGSSFTISGGTETTVGADKVHTFTTDGTLTVSGGTGTVDILLVGGGSGGNQGGAGNNGGGGGGGGEAKYYSSYTLTPGVYSVVIGGGGGGAAASFNAAGSAGTQTSILALGLTAAAGQITSTGDKSYGNNSGTGKAGGNESLVGSRYLGGGGGSTMYAVGTSPDGAIGYTSSISGSAVVYGSGGGAGVGTGGANSLAGGNGGTNAANGGSVNGSGVAVAPTNATANRGGGGGGGARGSGGTYTTGSNGGSGVLIVRWTPA